MARRVPKFGLIGKMLLRACADIEYVTELKITAHRNTKALSPPYYYAIGAKWMLGKEEYAFFLTYPEDSLRKPTKEFLESFRYKIESQAKIYAECNDMDLKKLVKEALCQRSDIPASQNIY